jgi:hypothetical protein
MKTLAFAGVGVGVVFVTIEGGLGIVRAGRRKTICLTHDDVKKLQRWLKEEYGSGEEEEGLEEANQCGAAEGST